MTARLLPATLAAAFLLLHLHCGAQAVDLTVYITQTGRSYHRDGCPWLERSRIPIALSEAAALGYAPCRTCDPPSPPAGASGPSVPGGLYRVNEAGVTRSDRAEPARMLRAVVVRHVDGDTVYVALPRPPAQLQSLERVRLLGVDTPQKKHPYSRGQRFGEQASEFTRRLLPQRCAAARGLRPRLHPLSLPVSRGVPRAGAGGARAGSRAVGSRDTLKPIVSLLAT
jgi:hypothetical protein